MRENDFALIEGTPSRALVQSVRIQAPADYGAGAGKREPANTKHENRNDRFNESVTRPHSVTLADYADPPVIRALRAKSNYLDSVARP